MFLLKANIINSQEKINTTVLKYSDKAKKYFGHVDEMILRVLL